MIQILQINIQFKQPPEITTITKAIRKILQIQDKLQLAMTDMKYNFLQYNLIDNTMDLKEIYEKLKQLKALNVSLIPYEIYSDLAARFNKKIGVLKPKTNEYVKLYYTEEIGSDIELTDSYWNLVLSLGNTKAKAIHKINERTIGCVIAPEDKVINIQQKSKVDLDTYNIYSNPRHILEVRRIQRINNTERKIDKQQKNSQESRKIVATEKALVIYLNITPNTNKENLDNLIDKILSINKESITNKCYIHSKTANEIIIVVFVYKHIRNKIYNILEEMREEHVEVRIELKHAMKEYFYNNATKSKSRKKVIHNRLTIMIKTNGTKQHSVPSLFSPLLKESSLINWKLIQKESEEYLVTCSYLGNYGALTRFYRHMEKLKEQPEIKEIKVDSNLEN